jgi:hypothetical protein
MSHTLSCRVVQREDKNPEDWDGKVPVEGGIRRLDWAGPGGPPDTAAMLVGGRGVGFELARRLNSPCSIGWSKLSRCVWS